MESPVNTDSGSNLDSSSTPKTKRKFYWAVHYDDGSPKLCGVDDSPEVFGWGDSPEPLRLDIKTSTCARKRLDPSESPLSSINKSKSRTINLTRNLAELNTDLTAINDLAQKVLRRSNSKSPDLAPLLQDDLAETLIACTQQAENTAEVEKEIKPLPRRSKPSPLANPISKKPLIKQNPSAVTSDLGKKTVSNRLAFQPKLGNNNKNTTTNLNSISNKKCGKNLITSQSPHSELHVHVPPIACQPTNDNNNSLLTTSARKISSSKVPQISSSIENCYALKTNLCSQKNVIKTIPNNNDVAEKSIDNLLKDFHEEEDDWLTQVIINDSTKTASTKTKGLFMKSLSDNQLESPGRGSTFRRAASFQLPENVEPRPLKKQKSFHVDEANRKEVQQCSLEEIEKKRLEAKFRRQFREIEQRRLEAERRRNEKLGINKVLEPANR